jgi:uncharacterized membrane protein YdjX (TVP38/TMEM64 family)
VLPQRDVERRHWTRLILLVAGVVLALWLVHSGAFAELHLEGIQKRLRAAGPWGMATFLLLFVTLQPLGASGHLFVLAAALVWPGFPAFALSLLGAVTGQGLAFLFYRYLAQSWAQRRVPRWLVRYERVLAERPFRSVIVLRILAFTAPFLPALLGISRVGFWPMITGTALGLSPTIAFDVWLGAGFLEWLFS